MKPDPSLQHKFKQLWPYYIIQSLLAAAVLLVVVLILGKEKMVVTSAMGATAFIVFAMPRSVSARRRNVIGSHILGLASGATLHSVELPYPVEYALAVGIVIFLMVALDFEHPPAAGTALAVVINEVNLDAFITILATAIVLSQSRYYLRHYLKDLV